MYYVLKGTKKFSFDFNYTIIASKTIRLKSSFDSLECKSQRWSNFSTVLRIAIKGYIVISKYFSIRDGSKWYHETFSF